METTPLLPSPDSDEIDLLALAKTLWNGRRTVLKSILICGVIGLFVALTSPNEYVATSIMIPSTSDGSSKLGGLGGFAAMAGINISNTSGSDLSPTVYPQIISSLPFQLELMQTPLNFNNISSKVTLYDYYTGIKKTNPLVKYTIGLPALILGIPGQILNAIKRKVPDKLVTNNEKTPIQLTANQQSVRSLLSGSVTLQISVKEGIITLTTKMPEPLAAAQLGQSAQDLLQQYITEFKIKKAKTNLDFIQLRYDEIAQKFESAQQQMATFSDRNKNVTLATARTEEEKLTRQYNLIYGIYSDMAKQLEQAKIQVKQDTPVFSILEPISVPSTRSKPNRPMILFIWLFVGVVLGTVIVFGKEIIVPIKRKWKEN